MSRLPILMMIIITLSSCSSRLSVQKRHFRPGYHVELSRPEGKVNDERKPKEGHEPSANPTVAGRGEKMNVDDHSLDPTVAPSMTDDTEAPVLASSFDVDKPSVVPQTRMLSQNKIYGRSNGKLADKELVHEVIYGNGHAMPLQPADSDGGNQGLKVAGIILTSVGFLLLLFISWLIGLIIMLLGIGLWIAGAGRHGGRSSGGSSKQQEPIWQDVVYLKNGSVIRGTIIEQVPGVSLKIQTTDGSIFVYEMEQVAKIAKEQK